MKKQAVLFSFLLLFLCSHAQKVQTIVPSQVVAGNAFQIQYIVTEPSTFVDIASPQFGTLRLISGPNYYKGNSMVNGKVQNIENITYTVMALKPGAIKIAGTRASFKNGKGERTEDAVINVIPQPKASFNTSSTYTDVTLYVPASKTDLDKLIDDNLFIKTEVDKTICFLGEAITATFKLYSRLQSTSEVINAPSLYGFSVMDILNINEAHQAVETINGKVFNTSVLRKLQLYPAQVGQLVIDEMQLQNEIEFNDSTSGKKIKIQKLLASRPVTISVKPLPAQVPVNYSGGVGKFTVSADFQNSKLSVNTEGRLIVTISGKGNFIQFNQPVIDWPKDFDVFDPLIEDELDKNKVPVEGRRIYTYTFTADHTGNFILPAVSFSFFNPSAQSYKNIHTDSLKLQIMPAPVNKTIADKKGTSRLGNKWGITALIAIAFLFLAFILFDKKKKRPTSPVPATKVDYVQKLHQAVASAASAKEVCYGIQKLLAEVNKEYKLTPVQQQTGQSIQNDCELLVYSDVRVEEEKVKALKKRTELFLQQLDP